MSHLSPYYVYFATQRNIEQDGYEIRFVQMTAHSQDNLQNRIMEYKKTIVASLGVRTIHAFRILTQREYFVLRTHYAQSEIDIPPYIEDIGEFDGIFDIIKSEASSETHLMS